MKKIFALITLSAVLFAEAVPVFAKSDFEDLAIGVLGTVINEAVKSGTTKNKTSTKKDSSKSTPTATTSTTTDENKSNSEPTTFTEKQDAALSSIGLAIESDLQELGNNILAYNKPTKEFKLTKEERLTPDLDDYENEVRSTPSPIMYSRVCVKGKTIVLGSAKKDKKFTADFIITGEPDFPPQGSRSDVGGNAKTAPRIYVGQNVNVLENYVGMSIENIAKIQKSETGTIIVSSESFIFSKLAYKDGKVAGLHYHTGYNLNSSKAWDFVKQKAKELGLTFADELY
ncbi:MAG: hypothetical protein IJ859_08510 [Synergistaceae bacterium]|nr:hypothetical protein [Synergistaceae bacterium]